MADHDDMLSQFTNLTNVDVERARFYLESSAWQLEVALASFYENNEDEDIQVISTPPTESPDVVEEVPRVPVVESKDEKASEPKRKAGGSSGSRFNTLAGLNQPNSEENSSDEEEGQAFYAGGSEHSGQQILGPSKKKKDIVSEMFKSVKEHGAEVVDPREPSTSKKSRAFVGTGYRLGQTAAESEVVPSTSSPRQAPPVEITLKMWKDGFSVDDGALREYNDPNNIEFLKSVRLGEVPSELVMQARGREVHLDMEDHRHEAFAAPKHKLKAFAGKGHLLGSPAPTTVGIVTPQPVGEQNQTANEEAARQAVSADTSQPTTTLQVRLADGSRLVGTFNHAHTIADVRRYINIARPQFQQQAFQLRTTFPSAELADDSKTLAQAGLLNAAILQRLT